MRFLSRLIALIVISAFIVPANVHAIQMEKLLGKILLQVESKGEAWYLDPQTKKRVSLGRPSDAFEVMRTLGKGITDKDLSRIAVSDESKAGDTKFARTFGGSIFLQVQSKGEAWYINPTNLKRYYLGTPSAAFLVMRQLGLGITNNDIQGIPSSEAGEVKQEQTATQEKTPPVEKKTSPQQKIAGIDAGTYRCWSYNVSGGGGSCTLSPAIVLKSDGTYSISSEQGTYQVAGDTLTLSQSKLRGPGKIIDGNKIRFEYDYQTLHHTVTYLLSSKEPGISTQDGQPSEVTVDVILEYPTKDSALNSISTIELVPKGQDVKTAPYKPTALAVWNGDRRVTGSFHKATNTPRTGIEYTVYASTGFGSTAVGTLDLTKTKTQIEAIIPVSLTGTSAQPGAAKQTEIQQSTAPEIVVEVVLEYSVKDSSLGSMTTVVLVPSGQDFSIASYKPTALAIWDGDKSVSGSFHKATNQVRAGSIYDVYTEYGGSANKVGMIDLLNVKEGPIKKVLAVTLPSKSISSPAPSGQTPQTSSPSSGTPQTQPSSGTPCNPSIPSYNQPGCIQQ